jgi:hypothetical protein
VAAAIREPVLRGHQAVSALWFPAAWFDEPARAARLIECWRPGATALRFAQGDLLCFATPIEEHCDDLQGWSLRLENGALCSAPLSDAERAMPREGDIWLVLGADVLTLHRRDGRVLDPSEWLAVDTLTLHETWDCSVPPPPPEILDLESRPLREVLGDAVPPASQERQDFLEAMRRAQRRDPEALSKVGRAPSREGRPGTGIGVPAGLLIGLAIVIVVIMIIALASGGSGFPVLWIVAAIWLIRGLLARADGDVAGGAAGVGRAQPARALPERTPLAHPRRWRRWLARLAMTTQLSRLLGRAHARHLQRMLEYFDDGNLDEALRHAIPLDNGEKGSLGPSFGLPGRRGNLDLSSRLGPSTSLGWGDDLQLHLRTLYRQAFEKLDREKRYDEAVFVLAELLDSRREALDYLEKHGRFEQAAELALGWDMPADVIVRLHCLAGDWRLAVAVARRDDAFASAIKQLESRWPDAAKRLREEWGETLRQRGDWMGAINAVWPVESLRSRATEWLLAAEAAGGRLAMRALAQRAMLLPDTLERYEKPLEELQRDPSMWRERLALAEALNGLERNAATRQLAVAITPALLMDHARGQGAFDRRGLEQFVQAGGDLLLQADLPTRDWPGMAAEPTSRRTELLTLDAPEAGSQEILDAVPLDDQRYLVALGEAGAVVVDAQGKIRARYATPAQQIVIAHSRQVALLLARREQFWRVTRVDLARKTTLDLGLLDFDVWAAQFDGLHWTIGKGRSLRVLDTQASLRQVVWQVPDLPGAILELVVSEKLEQLLIHLETGPAEWWTYRLPDRQLVNRSDIAGIPGRFHVLNPAGGVVGILIDGNEDGSLTLSWQATISKTQQVVKLPASALAFWVGGDWLVTRSEEGQGYVLRWMLLSSAAVLASLQWPGDSAPKVRLIGDRWIVHDDRGRLLEFNVATSAREVLSLR